VGLGKFLTAKGFGSLREADEPRVIREHPREYQYIEADVGLRRQVRNG
jgi:hypothetical protein